MLAKLRFVLELVETLINVAEDRGNLVSLSMPPRKVNFFSNIVGFLRY